MNSRQCIVNVIVIVKITIITNDAVAVAATSKANKPLMTKRVQTVDQLATPIECSMCSSTQLRAHMKRK